MSRSPAARRRHAEEPERGSAGPAAARPLRLLCTAAGALLLAMLVLRVSVANAFLEVSPGTATMLSPAHPEARLRHAVDVLPLSGAPDAAVENAARIALEREPLSEIPFLIAARRALAAGNAEQAEPLIALALRRNPRSRFALMLQLERDARRGNMRDVATRMAVLSRLSSNASALLVSQLAQMAAAAETRQAVVQVLADDPELKDRVLERLALDGADPEVIFALAGAGRRGATAASPPEWMQTLLNTMVERGRAATARRLWIEHGGASAAASAELVYDPDFAGLPGPPPFNWHLETGPDGFAERSRNSPGLQIEYYGRRDARLASQLILLPPGNYRLSFEAEGQAEGEDSRLAWVISCQRDDRPIGEVQIRGVEFTPKRFSGSFAVPAGCPAQWLRLVGKPAEFPKDQRVTARGLQIVRVGS